MLNVTYVRGMADGFTLEISPFEVQLTYMPFGYNAAKVDVFAC